MKPTSDPFSESTKILFIDDDPAITLLLTTRIGKLDGYTAISTNDPREAVELAAKEQPDIIVCDIDMGEVDGGQVAVQLEENPATKGIPVIFLSSLVPKAQSEAQDGLIGGRQMVSKSSKITDLIARIEKVLNDPV